ncbi:MAG: DUF262 domain-containing protein [Flavobacteriales bacterium]
MIDYRVRSVSLLNLVNDVKKGRLIPDAYFQRNLVWRDIHNKDFIKTILLGYPFPQIFISKGKIDIATMSTISCIVDGQQRTNAIISFIDNKYDVDGRFYNDLTDDEKSNFLKYEVAVIELDLENDDPKVQDIFQRINRTSNALSIIEKMASEYSTAEYMLVAKLLANEIELDFEATQEDLREDPNIPKEFFTWAKKQKVNKFQSLMTEKGIFSVRDIARKVHLMHILNIMSSILTDFFNRNERTISLLNDYGIDFYDKDDIVIKLEKTAEVILKIKLKQKSIWLNKSNSLSLIVGIAKLGSKIDNLDLVKLKTNLEKFEQEIPADFKLASSEGVNNKKERELRNTYVTQILENSK